MTPSDPPKPTFAFTGATLHAPSFLALIGNTNELRLHVMEDDASMEGDGYPHEVQAAFTAIVFEWEATCKLNYGIPLPPGTYSLSRRGDRTYVRTDGEEVALPDGPATVTLRASIEEQE